MRTPVSRRAILSIGAAFAVCAALVGCGSQQAASTGSGASAASGSGSASGEKVELQVFAANSLEKAMPEVQKLYTEKTGTTFADTQFKGSGDLVEQMKGGAQADLFVSASKSTMDQAQQDKLVDESTRTDMFKNDLVIVKAKGSDVKIASLADVAGVDGKIAIGEARAVPAGKYANQALASVKLYTNADGTDGQYADSIKDKVSLVDKVGTAAKQVSTGDAKIGFVYSSDVYRYDGIEVAYVTPADSHKAIVYPGAVTSNAKQAKAAADFMKFCLEDKQAQDVWAKYGFELAE